MVEETVAEAIEANLERADSATEDMDMVEDVAENGAKRAREGEEEENEDVLKKQKVDKAGEEGRLEKIEEEGKAEGEGGREEKEEKKEEEEKSGPVSLGPKSFGSAVEMFDYFYNFLHQWPPNIKVNKYEHMMLVDLLKTGHSEPDKKIGSGIQAFQVRFHPRFKSRCFFLIRDDDTVDDFSFRKCVDHILPLPENLKVKSDNFLGGGKGHGGKGGPGGRGGRGRGRGYGRGGRSRN
ncbi:PREDICTED: protein DCL, chloroplastic-like [Populus euphratica]|uniref:Protein DCL, chloroplastic-like n=1 Tax=Populus euphratica TaxID=75702 RepID=A0AAJ6XLR0_POPEU|nr:PREDICTED: protein DCL, chloroplastic-like [Populus euphratica]XP_011023608.1 PREDICTED: protein DCL, chloroplastic-like [Populus euphratica]